MAQGLYTPVRERGLALSTGQRQRVALARALYLEPEVLILDEATAALDTQNEDEMLTALRALPDGLTQVIVSHRLSTVSACVTILVLDGGRVVAQGALTSLLATRAPRDRNPSGRNSPFIRPTRGSWSATGAVGPISRSCTLRARWATPASTPALATAQRPVSTATVSNWIRIPCIASSP